MDRRQRHETVLAICLTSLAGYADALGLISLKDLFISFMSGNSTQFAVRTAQGAFAGAWKPALLISTFVLGAMAGSVVGRLAGSRRPPAVMAAVALVLAGAALIHLSGQDFVAAVAMALAMGIQNGVFDFVRPLLLWLGLICGGLLGAAAWAGLGLNALWIGAAAAAALAFAAGRLQPAPP